MFKPKAKHLHPVEEIPPPVAALREAGIEPSRVYYGQGAFASTVSSVLFAGDRNDGWAALAVLLRAGLDVSELRRIWNVSEGELVGPSSGEPVRFLETLRG